MMADNLADFLRLTNNIVQAAIVIFGVAVALYNLRHSLRERVTRAFNSLLFFVVVVYFTEMMAAQTAAPISTELWVRLEWIGIAMVPAAQFHLADALLVTTGDTSRSRRIFVRVWYLTGVALFLLVLLTDSVVSNLITVTGAPHLTAGPIFILFAAYFWAISATSVYLVWRARQRCVTDTTKKRMSVILATFLAAPLAVFPYLTFSRDPNSEISTGFWFFIIFGNVTISVMFAFLTYYIAYFGARSPDRVVRVRLFKYMARVPLAATIVLLTYIGISRAGDILGIPTDTALAIAVVSMVILVEWAIYAFKRPLERLFQLTDEPEVRRIQQLSERLVTTRDMRQFLESVLAATCDVLRTPTAFVAGFTSDGPTVEAFVGPINGSRETWVAEELDELAPTMGSRRERDSKLETKDSFIIWRDYWIRPLRNRQDDALVGILGIKSRSESPDLSEDEEETFDRLAEQAAYALEDRLMQQDVFASVEGLLPQVTALQQRRSAATFGGTPVLTSTSYAEESTIVTHPDFSNMVWDALSHYWGGPKLTESPLLRLQIVQRAMDQHEGNPTKALREILVRAVEQQRPEGERNMTTGEWILYNILELKFIQGQKVRDVARRLAMSESDLYRKQRVAIENVAQTISLMEEAASANSE